MWPWDHSGASAWPRGRGCGSQSFGEKIMHEACRTGEQSEGGQSRRTGQGSARHTVDAQSMPAESVARPCETGENGNPGGCPSKVTVSPICLAPRRCPSLPERPPPAHQARGRGPTACPPPCVADASRGTGLLPGSPLCPLCGWQAQQHRDGQVPEFLPKPAGRPPGGGGESSWPGCGGRRPSQEAHLGNGWRGAVGA